MTDTPITTRYFHANCGGVDIDFTTEGRHKPESADVHEFPFSCPRCGGKHVALEVNKDEREILKAQDPGDGAITPEMVERLESDMPPELVLNVDVMQVAVTCYEDFDAIATSCRECDEDIDFPTTVYVWGEPLGDGKYVAINTFDTEKCLNARLERYMEQQGKQALLIKFRG